MRLIRRRAGSRSRGQSLVEFSLVALIFMTVLMAIVQFGLILWSQVTITQIARDTGRWAATQEYMPSSAGAPYVNAQAAAIAAQSSLYGYPAFGLSVNTTYNKVSGPGNCPAENNDTVCIVKVSMSHQVPLFMPMMPATWTVSSSAEYRLEPVP